MLGCSLFCGKKEAQIDDNVNTPYMISDLTINYSQSIRPYCLGDHMTVEEFLALSDLRKTQVNDSSIIALFQEIITASEKDTVRFVRDTVIIDDICFDPVTWQTVEPEEGEEHKGIVDVYGYWENGPSACYVVELHNGCGTDTLIIPNSPSIVQYNNTVFKDSTLFYTVTALISENDAEWAKGHFRESQNRDDCPVYRFKYENTPTGDITFLQQ